MVVPDYKYPDGSWVRFRKINKEMIATKSAMTYSGILSRCRVGGYEQNRQPSYIGCINNFSDFQTFAEWCQHRVGYSKPGFELDKDILVKGNKVYSENTCVFLPKEVNLLLTNCKRSRGELPVGVTYNPCHCNYAVQVRLDGKLTRWTGFESIEDAFNCYKKLKEDNIRMVANRYREVIDERAYDALMSYVVEITD